MKDPENKILRIERLALKIGFKENFAKTLSRISKRKDLLNETIAVLKSIDYKSSLEQYKKMRGDPYTFYQKNKKIRNLENKLLTLGSLSFSYSFCSPYKVIRDIIKDSYYVNQYVGVMRETSDENYSLKSMDLCEFFQIREIRTDQDINYKYKSLLMDLRGNNVPEEIILELSEKVKFQERMPNQDSWGIASITQESLIDSFYIFFGSKKGDEFVEKWKIPENREKLKEEFEYLIYNNPYVNPLHVGKELKDFMSKEHIAFAESFLKKNERKDLRKFPNECVNFGLRKEENP